MKDAKTTVVRRDAIATAVGALAMVGTAATESEAQLPRSEAASDFRVKNNRIRQSVMGWCFNPMKPEILAQHCVDMGIVGIEGIPVTAYPAVKKIGLEISLVGSHGFARGPCDPKYQDETVQKLTEAIETADQFGAKRVITFTGMKFEGMDVERAAADCIRIWKQVLPLAEKKGITLCLEHLNSRDDSHPMKGHPGYLGDDVDFCFELVRKMGSPHFKLLFDIYHVSIMNGDIIRRIQRNHELIGHYHTAGNPGRAELDDTQEINYPAILKVILETGYQGYVAQEFIPTWNDPIAALRHAVQVCDIG